MEITRTGATTGNAAMVLPLAPKASAEAQKASADTKVGTAEVSEGTESSSGLKSFAFGALDLEKPDAQAQETDGAYTAGKWLGAAAKVGGLITLLA